MQVRCQEFYNDCGVLQRGTGISVPIALTLKKQEDGWNVEIQKPSYGSAGGVSIYDIAPPQAWPRISAPTGRTADGKTLSQNNSQQAEDYFGLSVNPTPKWLLPATPTNTPIPTSFVQIITLTPTPTVDVSALNLAVTKTSGYPTDHSDGQYRLMVQLGGGFLNHQLTSFQKGQLSSGWRVHMYQRRVDGDYSDQKALVLDDVKDPRDQQYTFYVETTLEKIRYQFGSHRDLVYQIIDEAGNVVWQDELYLSIGLSPLPANHNEAVAEGVVVGYPNLLSEDTWIFTHQGKFITIKEPQGGFDRLAYMFDLTKATGIITTSEMEALTEGLAIRLFTYREDGEYAIANSDALLGEVFHGGYVFQVHFLIEMLAEAFKDDHMVYLRITDGDGNILKEEYFHFVPYIQ
jgi:hypothetical protein